MRVLIVTGALFTGALLILTFWAVWNNSASERIVAAAVPLVVVTLGAAAAVYLILVLSAAEPISGSFRAGFTYLTGDRRPVKLPFRTLQDTQMLVAELQKRNPQVFPTVDTYRLYHHLLQKSFVAWMQMRFRNSWSGASSRAAPRVLSGLEVQQRMNDNLFASVDLLPPDFTQITLPPGTDLLVRSPNRAGEEGEIRLRNKLCTVAIVTTFSSSGIGAQGAYGTLIGQVPFSNPDLSHVMYRVRHSVTFNQYLSGHPDMAPAKQWAMELVDGLRAEFDEDGAWQRTRDYFVVNQLLPEASRQTDNLVPLGNYAPLSPNGDARPDDNAPPQP